MKWQHEVIVSASVHAIYRAHLLFFAWLIGVVFAVDDKSSLSLVVELGGHKADLSLLAPFLLDFLMLLLLLFLVLFFSLFFFLLLMLLEQDLLCTARLQDPCPCELLGVVFVSARSQQSCTEG
ncbi:unnamed protein product [Polarella glacialis]|uniref:Uncharacterized protein n=1 Tax=Polarella glacialis TaxID=89957 RepID=A0A813LXM3_POLGL|nr:unnamed protein product [Polarella glacialis]